MPYRVTFALDLFNGERERQLSREALQILLDALYKIDIAYLRKHPETPSVYQANVRYMEEPPGQEDWQDIPTCLKMRIADCEDLACWRAAELVVKYGINAFPVFVERKRPDGGMLYHILVQWPKGQIPRELIGSNGLEDPSKILGMR